MKKLSGSWARITSISKSSGSFRLNSYGRNDFLEHSSSYLSRRASMLAVALLNEMRRRESVTMSAVNQDISREVALTIASTFTPEAVLLVRFDDQLDILVDQRLLDL